MIKKLSRWLKSWSLYLTLITCVLGHILISGFKPASHIMTLTSTSFSHQQKLPVQFTCDGANFSPQLSWSGAPAGTKSFALICDDPDAPHGTWVHWVLFNIPANILGLVENTEPVGLSGTNSFGKFGYGGACPPKGHGTHHYIFKIYALDCMLDLQQGATKKDLELSMSSGNSGNHILAYGELIGIYER